VLRLVLGGALVIVVMALVLPEAWLVSVMLQPGGDWWLAGQSQTGQQRVRASGGIVVVPAPQLGAPPSGSARGMSAIDPAHLAAIQQAAAAAPCQLDWTILAGVGHQETGFGRNSDTWTPHAGGIVGETQFSPGAWATYGDGAPLTPATPLVDQYAATARYLCALGITTDPTAALGHYSGCWPCGRTDGYPQDVLSFAASLTAPVASVGQALIDQARTWLGTPYVFGGSSTAGIDCSALVYQVFRSIGVTLLPPASAQYAATTPTSSPVPGDLVFFANTYEPGISHVGIVSRIDPNGTVWMIDAPTTGEVVREEPIAGYWSQHFAGFRRVGAA
jgi:cell wall-associated NlpC family hydrolase